MIFGDKKTRNRNRDLRIISSSGVLRHCCMKVSAVAMLNVLAVGHFFDAGSGIASAAGITSRLSVFDRKLDADAQRNGLSVVDILGLTLAVLLIRQAAAAPNRADNTPPPVVEVDVLRASVWEVPGTQVPPEPRTQLGNRSGL